VTDWKGNNQHHFVATPIVLFLRNFTLSTALLCMLRGHQKATHRRAEIAETAHTLLRQQLVLLQLVHIGEPTYGSRASQQAARHQRDIKQKCSDASKANSLSSLSKPLLSGTPPRPVMFP
jgi:hypothetical protein